MSHGGDDELLALYRHAEVLVITPLRDGMNTTPFEYVLCREVADEVATVVLSEFAGCARSLGGAILVNPWDTTGFAKALREALEPLPLEPGAPAVKPPARGAVPTPGAPPVPVAKPERAPPAGGGRGRGRAAAPGRASASTARRRGRRWPPARDAAAADDVTGRNKSPKPGAADGGGALLPSASPGAAPRWPLRRHRTARRWR